MCQYSDYVSADKPVLCYDTEFGYSWIHDDDGQIDCIQTAECVIVDLPLGMSEAGFKSYVDDLLPALHC